MKFGTLCVTALGFGSRSIEIEIIPGWFGCPVIWWGTASILSSLELLMHCWHGDCDVSSMLMAIKGRVLSFKTRMSDVLRGLLARMKRQCMKGFTPSIDICGDVLGMCLELWCRSYHDGWECHWFGSSHQSEQGWLRSSAVTSCVKRRATSAMVMFSAWSQLMVRWWHTSSNFVYRTAMFQPLPKTSDSSWHVALVWELPSQVCGSWAQLGSDWYQGRVQLCSSRYQLCLLIRHSVRMMFWLEVSAVACGRV